MPSAGISGLSWNGRQVISVAIAGRCASAASSRRLPIKHHGQMTSATISMRIMHHSISRPPHGRALALMESSAREDASERNVVGNAGFTGCVDLRRGPPVTRRSVWGLRRRALDTFLREVRGDDGAFARFADDFHRTAVQFDQPLGERQAQPRTVVAAVEAGLDLAEWRQSERDLFGGDTDTGVGDANGETAFGLALDRDADLATGRRELHGV